MFLYEINNEFDYILAANKFRKKLQDVTVLEREEIVLEVEMLEKKAPVKWYKDGGECYLQTNERLDTNNLKAIFSFLNQNMNH